MVDRIQDVLGTSLDQLQIDFVSHLRARPGKAIIDWITLQEKGCG